MIRTKIESSGYRYNRKTRQISRDETPGVTRTVRKQIRMTEKEHSMMQKLADKYSGGNLTLYIMYNVHTARLSK